MCQYFRHAIMFTTSATFPDASFNACVYSRQGFNPNWNMSCSTNPSQTTTYSTQKIPISYVNLPQCSVAKPTVTRRGRRSSIPPEQREQTRRLKKQNMERRRRACISDKMTALHKLAMSVIGLNPDQHQKVEKADILSICYNVFEGIAKIANEEPEIRAKLHQLRSHFGEHASRVQTPDDNTQSSTISEVSDRMSEVLDSQLQCHQSNKENVPSSETPTPHPNRPGQELPLRLLKRHGIWQSTPVCSSKAMRGLTAQSFEDSGIHSPLNRCSVTFPESGSNHLAPNTLICNVSSDFSMNFTDSSSSQFTHPSPLALRKTAFSIPQKRSSVASPVTCPKSDFTLPSPYPVPARQQQRPTDKSPSVWRPYLD